MSPLFFIVVFPSAMEWALGSVNCTFVVLENWQTETGFKKCAFDEGRELYHFLCVVLIFQSPKYDGWSKTNKQTNKTKKHKKTHNNNRFSKAFGYRLLMDDSSEYKVVDSYDGWVLESG